jgi:two-component system, response regulator PdtaR
VGSNPTGGTLAAAASLGAMTAAPPLRVLVAEDESLIRLDLVEMLREEGYDVCGEAGDGQTAVELAERLRPDLVVLDVKMPVLDGLSAAEQIVRARIAPVVILTAFSQRDLVERAREAGAMAYLVKPFQKKDLLPTVEMAVSRFTELVALEREVADLSGRLEARKVVERAKGVLQSEHGMTEPAAFRWIQRLSMDGRRPMRAVAQDLLDGVLSPQDPPTGPPSA